MNGLGGPSPFSPHNDVLNAKPETPAAVNSLLTELKSRCRSSVVSKRFEDAVQFYTKAIEIAFKMRMTEMSLNESFRCFIPIEVCVNCK